MPGGHSLPPGSADLHELSRTSARVLALHDPERPSVDPHLQQTLGFRPDSRVLSVKFKRPMLRLVDGRSLLAEPTTITSIGHRGWAHVGQK